jgi:TetR/AcrR family transcriptional regulator
MPIPTKLRTGSRHQPEQTRAAILDAAMREFALEGVAGARTEEIARAAGVNKALLYYYFKDKEALFGAVMDQVFSALTASIDAALESGLPPRQRFLAYLEAHFDFVASSPMRPKLFHREMMRSGRNGSPHLKRIVEKFFRPTFSKLAELIEEGVEAGDFRPVDPAHFIPSVIGVIVFYFSTPVPKMITGRDPYSRQSIAERRSAVIDFVSAALFRDYQGIGANKGESGATGTPDLAGLKADAAKTRRRALSRVGAKGARN